MRLQSWEPPNTGGGGAPLGILDSEFQGFRCLLTLEVISIRNNARVRGHPHVWGKFDRYIAIVITRGTVHCVRVPPYLRCATLSGWDSTQIYCSRYLAVLQDTRLTGFGV